MSLLKLGRTKIVLKQQRATEIKETKKPQVYDKKINLVGVYLNTIPFLTTSNSISKSFSNLIIVIELTSKTNKSQDVESQLLHDKQENEAVGKANCSTSSGNAISHNTTTSNEPNKSLRMKRNEEKNSLPSNGRENGEFTQENLMR